jgi:hypothetical protein
LALEATAEMEQLATALSRANKIAPNTAHEIDRVMQQPNYDCTQMDCGPALEARNRIARSKLKRLLGKFAPLDKRQADASLKMAR